jgi:hypothetical protein
MLTGKAMFSKKELLGLTRAILVNKNNVSSTIIYCFPVGKNHLKQFLLAFFKQAPVTLY